MIENKCSNHEFTEGKRSWMEYLSFSRLSLYETCGLRFFYEYVQQLEPVDSVPTYHASFGKLLHSLYEAHANSGGELDFADLKSEFDEQFPQLVPEFPERSVAVGFYKSGIQAIFRFSRYRVEDVLASEKEFLLPMGNGVPPIKGFIDRVIYTDSHGYIVADLKTGKPFSGRHPVKFKQLVIYSLACEHIYGVPAQSGYFDFVVNGSREWVNLKDEDRKSAHDWVFSLWRKIQGESFEPHYSPGFCPAYCPYRSICPAFAKVNANAAIYN